MSPESVVSQKINVVKAIVHTERNELRDALRQELKALSVKDIVFPANIDACIAEVVISPGTPLILDWEVGAAGIVRILAASRTHFKIDTRPIFLIASEVSEIVVQAAYEYGVAKLHSGEISRLEIKESLQDLLISNPDKKHIMSILSSVAEARRRNEWSVATPLLSSLAEKHPDNAMLQCELAENLIHEKRWSEAIPLLEPHARGDRPDVRSQHILARCLLNAGKNAAAAKLLQSAKLLNPFNVDRLIELGEVLLGQDRLTEAKETFDEARGISPRRADATVGAAKCRLLLGDINEALGLLKNISGPRELAAIFNTTAILAMQHGNHDKGMSLYRSALKSVGEVPQLKSRLHFNMGIGYRRWKKLEEALECFDKALLEDPKFTKAKKHREAASKVISAQLLGNQLPAEQAKRQAPARSSELSVEIVEETFDDQQFEVDSPKVEIGPFSLNDDDEDF